MIIPIDDNDVRVEKLPKMKGHQESGEKPPRGVEKRVRVRTTKLCQEESWS
jgi:hypothetical protein